MLSILFRNMKNVLRAGLTASKQARAGEWWGYKIGLTLATGYATADLLNRPLWPLISHLLLLILALTIGAIYVSILNDWTDRADDWIADKPNRLANKSDLFVGKILAACLVAGSGFGLYFWWLNPLNGLLYLGSWTAYSFYSLPPFRLKVRGLTGVLADAFGAHAFPHLLTVSLVACWLEQPLAATWGVAVGVWSLACGIRNILKHQLGDAVADKHAGVRTLVSRWGDRRAYQLGAWVIFPIEVLAFGSMLALLGQGLPLLFLLFYLLLELLRARFWRISPVVLDPSQRLLFDEYYSIFFPLSLLLTQCLRYPIDCYVLLFHELLFGWHALGTAHETKRLLTTALRMVRS